MDVLCIAYGNESHLDSNENQFIRDSGGNMAVSDPGSWSVRNSGHEITVKAFCNKC